MARAPKNAAPVHKHVAGAEMPAQADAVTETASEAAQVFLDPSQENVSMPADEVVVYEIPKDGSPEGGTPIVQYAQVKILSALFRQSVQRESLIVVCREPGFRRAGIEHPLVAVYPYEDITDQQLALMQAEPMLVVIEVD